MMLCSVVYPGQFVAWVTCLLREYEDIIVAGLVKKGYVVSVCSTNGQLTSGGTDRPAVVVTVRVDSKDESKKASDIHKDLIDILHEKKVLYYSVIVSAYSDSCWIPSNITMPKPSPTPEPTPPIPSSETNKKLN